MKCCPTCGRPFAPVVNVGGVLRQQFYDYVASHPEGVNREQIINHLYHERRDGGPNTLNIIAVMAKQINKRLEKQHVPFRLKGRGGPGSVYILANINDMKNLGKIGERIAAKIAAAK